MMTSAKPNHGGSVWVNTEMAPTGLAHHVRGHFAARDATRMTRSRFSAAASAGF
ncbi:MAG: hypothetical protein HC779_03915 [Phyllobacteriaceae bacterium]|nr:hypothetical protein [Phyllobacteriaceae bacterium]